MLKQMDQRRHAITDEALATKQGVPGNGKGLVVEPDGGPQSSNLGQTSGHTVGSCTHLSGVQLTCKVQTQSA